MLSEQSLTSKKSLDRAENVFLDNVPVGFVEESREAIRLRGFSGAKTARGLKDFIFQGDGLEGLVVFTRDHKVKGDKADKTQGLGEDEESWEERVSAC